MKPLWVVCGLWALLASGAQAQDRIYRCGNEYTNTVRDAQARGCKLVEGANVTIVPAPKLANPSPAPARTGLSASSAAPAAVPGSGPRVNAEEQKARDSDARRVLETELRRAEQRQAELQREYNNGEPEKRPEETRNHQKYLDRVAELKASLARNESDIAGIRRELARVGAPAPLPPQR
jgi:hypothetical protein